MADAVLQRVLSGAESARVLVPYNPDEAVSIKEAAAFAGRCPATIRDWCNIYSIGRRVPANGPWAVSRAALAMFLEGDHDALQRYLRGQRASAPPVAIYFKRLGIPVPADVTGGAGNVG